MHLKDKGGALVAEVVPDSPAAKAGLKDGDVITALAGEPVKSAAELPWAVATLKPGKPTDVSVYHDGSRRRSKVTVAEQPADFGELRAAKPATIPDGNSVHLGEGRAG